VTIPIAKKAKGSALAQDKGFLAVSPSFTSLQDMTGVMPCGWVIPLRNKALVFCLPVSATPGVMRDQCADPLIDGEMNKDIRIYVADLAAYNAGYLHGVWIDATLEVADIQAEISTMLKASPVEDAEEYAIHDYEGFDGYSLGEYSGIDTAHDVASFIAEYPNFGGALLAYWGDIEEAKHTAENRYCGCYMSLADYAQELTEQTSDVPEHLSRYIDYDAMGRDMELGGDVFTVETGFQEVHIFWSH
jgi:antirestriction protein